MAETQPAVFYEQSSPIMLAAQPSDPKPGKPVKNWATIRGIEEQKLVSLRAWRSSWWQTNWSDLAKFILPRRSIWLTQSAGGWPTPNNMTRGREINQAIADPAATYAARVCSGGLMFNLAGPSRPWFRVMPAAKSAQIDSDGRAWLDEVEDRIYTVLAGSNFYNSFAQECEDITVFGTGVSIIYDDEKDIVRFYNPCMGEFYLATDATMRVNGLFRQFLMTIEQMVGFFGAENCPEEVQKLWQEKGAALQTERIIAHSIEPNFALGKDNLGVVPGNFAWRECYWVFGTGSDYPLSMRGFVDQPFTANRWSTQSNDAYGRGPGMDALPDVAQLQVMTMRMAEAIEKQVRPPLLADMQLKNQPSSILPGDVTFVPSLGPNTGMRSIYDVNPDIRAMSENIAVIEGRIKVAFFNDVFMAVSNLQGDRRTATEINIRKSEALQVLGPVVESLINESLKPKLARVFGIMKRRGLIPPPPDSLKGMPLDISFISELAVAQKASSLSGMEQVAGLIGNLSAVFPQAKDLLNVDVYVNEYAKLLATPNNIINSADVVQKTRAAAAKMAQQQQQLAMAHGIAQTASVGADAASTLAGINVGQGAQAVTNPLGAGQ